MLLLMYNTNYQKKRVLLQIKEFLTFQYKCIFIKLYKVIIEVLVPTNIML